MLKNKKVFIALAGLLLIAVIGTTVAYFTSNATFENLFRVGTYKLVSKEVFEAPNNWTPGQTIPKSIVTKNEGTVPAAIRASITEQWFDGETDITSQVAEGTVIINYSNTNNWEHEGNYYYYKYPLNPGEITTSFIKSVTLSSNINNVQCTSSQDGKTQTCESTSNIAGATYILTITKETVQYDKYQDVWETNVNIEGEPVIEETSEESIFDFDSITGKILGFKSSIHPTPTEINIPDKIDNVDVKIIGEGAFYGKGLTSVRLPNTLTTIADGAFSGTDPSNPSEGTSNNLTEIKIPEGVTTIGIAAFQYNSLERVVLPTTLRNLGNYAFYNNPTLVSAFIPEGLTKIGDSTFQNCGLLEIEVPSTITTIGNNAFYKGIIDESNSNLNLTKIINKSSNSFNWSEIVSTTSTSEDTTFVTGTIPNQYGNVTVTTE